MDELCSQAEQHADILKRCSSSEVKNWGKEDLSRALQWCKYFSEVYVRIAKKSSFIKSFDEKLKAIGYSLAFRCGENDLTAEFLSRSSEYLIKVLLENPALPQAVREDLEGAGLNVEQHLAQAEKDRILLSTLQMIHSRLVTHCAEAKVGLILTDAKCVYNDLQWCLQSPAPKTTIHMRLESLSQEEGGLQTILYTYLIQPDGQLGSIIIRWLLQLLCSWTSPPEAAAPYSNSRIHKFWRDIPHRVLADVSSHSDEFCDSYLTFLHHWTKQLVKGNHIGDGGECRVLAQQLQVLAMSSPKLKELCIQMIGSHFDFSTALQRSTTGSQCVGIWDQLMGAVTTGVLPGS